MVRAWRFFSLCIIVVLLILSQSALASQEPVVSELAKTLKEDKTTVITLRGKSPLHKKLSYSIVQSPKHGSVIIKGNKARYTPQVDYFGLDDFLYQASDGTLTSIAANVKLAVTSVNDIPIAMAQTAIVGKGVSSVITLTARDIDGDPLAYKITSKPKKGSVNITGNLVTYTPKKADFQGKDSFTFKVNDGKKSSKPARVDLTISSAKQGKFIDACVSGLGFKTSSGIKGLTNQNCEYFFEDGDTIEFFVGNTKIASLPAKSLTSVLEVENSAQAAMFLQSLDSDKNPENGISIPDDTHTLLEKNTLTLEEVNPDDLAFIQKYKAITNKDFITNEVDALAHAESALKLELAKDMDWYPYYTGQVDIYKTLEPADEEYFLNNFRPRLELYFYNYIVFSSLMLDSTRAYDLYSIDQKKNAYVNNIANNISDFLTVVTLAIKTAKTEVDYKGNPPSKEHIKNIAEAAVGKVLDYIQDTTDNKMDGLLGRGINDFIFDGLGLYLECKDLVNKSLSDEFDIVDLSLDIANCSGAISNKVVTTVYDAHSAYFAYTSSIAINTNIVVRAYLYEYYRTGGSDAAVKYKYGSYGPYSGIAAVIQGVSIKELSQESHVFGIPVNVGSDIDMEKAIEKINDYKARVSNAVTNITKTFDLKNKPAEKLVESVSVNIVNGKTSVADGGHKLHVCYQVKNNAYFYISNVKLDFGFVEYDSGAKIFTKLESLNMNELAPRSNEEQCHYLSVPDSFLQNPEENSRILLFRATYGNNIEISDTQIINFAAQNDIKEIIDQFLDPTVIATASGAIDGIIYLDASGSSVHKSQGTLSFVWEQIPTLNAPKIAINDANSDKASINVPSLPPNQTQQSLAFKVKATASVSGRSAYKTVFVTIKSKSNSAETPNVTISSVNVSPTNINPGQPIVISTTLVNDGNAASNSSLLYYYVNTPTVKKVCANVPMISPSLLATISCDIYAPSSAGIYDYGVCYGNQCTNATSVSVTNPIIKSVRYVGETTPKDKCANYASIDGNCAAQVQRGDPLTKTWTFKNNGNVNLSSLEVVLVNQQGNLSPSVVSNVPSSVSVGSNFTYTLNFTIPRNAPAGVYRGQYKVQDANDPAGLSQVFWYAFNVPQPQAFEGALYPSTTELVKNDALTLGIKINRGEAPYQVSILWGDGSTGSLNNVTNDVIESVVKNYSTTGIYTIEVQITDSIGQTITLTSPLKVTDTPTHATTWQGSGQDLDTSESNPDIPIAISSTSPYSYKIDWKPQGSAVDYFTKYRLAVPSGLMSLGKKMRLTVGSKGFFIPDYDRALTLVTNTGKHYTSAILAATPGFTRYLDINNGVENKTFTASLQDSGLGLAVSDRFYALELNPDGKQRTYLYENSHFTQLYANDIGLDSNENLSQIDISFKGVGQVDVAILDFDKDGNGTYEGNERYLLTTSSGTVIWDQTITNDLDFKNFGPLPTALLSPNGGETLISGVSSNITWNPNLIQGSTVSIYVLHDDPSTLKSCASADANDLLSCKNWYLMQSSVSNTGSLVFDPADMQGVGSAYLVLIVSDANPQQWDVSDTTFTLTNNNLVSFIKLNDTGITTCSNAASSGLACPVADFPSQDAESGRDVTHNDDSDGHAGFSFTKLDSSGNPLPASANQWDCVKDNVTGLIWEVKTNDGGLRDQHNTYSWYEPDNSKNGGDPGMQNGGSCIGSSCDTQGYVQAVNALGLCGVSDWRMPASNELISIVNNSRSDPAIDTSYFPNSPNSLVWSSSPEDDSRFAWCVHFQFGDDRGWFKASNGRVRLVRGGQ